MNNNDCYYDIENARQLAIGCVENIKNMVERTKNGAFSGRLYEKLINQDPINSALESMHAYQKTANKYNKEIDEAIVNEMKKAENDLFDVLIKNKGDSETLATIQSIIKTKKYGLILLDRLMNENNCLSLTDILPEDTIVVILSNIEAQELGRLMQVSTLFNHYANSDIIWKALCEKKCIQTSNLEKLKWKQIYQENDLDKYEGRDTLWVNTYGKILELYINLAKIDIKSLKRLIQKKEYPNCELSEITPIFCGKIIDDTNFDRAKKDIKYEGRIYVVIRKRNPTLLEEKDHFEKEENIEVTEDKHEILESEMETIDNDDQNKQRCGLCLLM